MCFHLLFLTSKLWITHWIQVHKENPTKSKQEDVKKIVKTKTLECTKVGEKELKCMALYFNQYKNDNLGFISLLWDSKS